MKLNLKLKTIKVLNRLLSNNILEKIFVPLKEDKLVLKLGLLIAIILGGSTLLYAAINIVIAIAKLQFGLYISLSLSIFLLYLIYAIDNEAGKKDDNIESEEDEIVINDDK